jgi:hypothetical protein
LCIFPKLASCVFKEVENGISRVATLEGLGEGVPVIARYIPWNSAKVKTKSRERKSLLKA